MEHRHQNSDTLEIPEKEESEAEAFNLGQVYSTPEMILNQLNEFVEESGQLSQHSLLRIITNNLTAGPFADDRFLKHLMNHVIQKYQPLSLIVTRRPVLKDQRTAAELIEVMAEQEEYKDLISLKLVREDQQIVFVNHLKEYFKGCKLKIVQDLSHCTLFFNENGLLRLYGENDEWRLESFIVSKVRTLNDAINWFDQVITEEKQVKPYHLIEEQGITRKGTSFGLPFRLKKIFGLEQ